MALVSTQRPACSFNLQSAHDSAAHRRVKYWTATGAFWGAASGLLGGPTLFYSVTGVGLEADLKQALASLVCGAAGAMMGAAGAAIVAILMRRRVRSEPARRFTSSGLRLVDISEAREYGLYNDQLPVLATREEPAQ
nr:hypothetical protein [Burkholderia sp. Ac-20365]